MTRILFRRAALGASALLSAASVPALAGSPAGYYSGVQFLTPQSVRDTLHTTIDDHLRYNYSNPMGTDVWDIIESADEYEHNSSMVLDIYKNTVYPKHNFGNNDYDREHSWPKSYGFDKDVVANYPYTDCHHLFVADGSYNSSRNNKPYDWGNGMMGEKPTTLTDGEGGGLGSYPGNSNWTAGGGGDDGVWETWIGRRGDVARALLYMDVRYEGGTHGVTGHAEPDLILTDDRNLIVTSKNLEPVGYMGIKSVLLQWHAQDPPDARERRRNDVVYSYQGNRNPFIDYPEWVGCVFEGECEFVWINEFHYDNTGADTGEFVEIAGVAGVDLTGWQVLGYDGATGTVYKTVNLSGLLPQTDGCFGLAQFAFTGMQNDIDGLALINDAGMVVDFISYEGAFTATAGPAAGLPSVNIGASESGSTPAGHSLQLMGSGAGLSGFVWDDPAASTPAATNAMQIFEGNCTTAPAADPWINEFHYDDNGADSDEFVEIAGPAGTDLTGWQVLAYNGANGTVYDTLNLSGIIPDQQAGAGTLNFAFAGLQNGDPDGLALVSPGGTVVLFISYDGGFTATSGAAMGMTAQDIGVGEPTNTPEGQSLRLTGSGCAYEDFAWQSPAASSQGAVNSGQTFVSCN